jgi:hypothetical protein
MADIWENVRIFAAKKKLNSSMRKTFLTCWTVLVTVIMLPSCLGSDDDEVTLYDDTAITTFTLGTLNRYLITKASTGVDSMYKVTFAGSTFKMNIDHLGGRIFNTDSLPTKTDLKHVVCTLTTKNSGLVAVKSLTSDSLTVISSTDSIDLSKPRIFRVFSTDGMHTADYRVTLTARQVEAGTLVWKEMPTSTEVPNAQWTDWQFAFNSDRTGIIATNDHWATSITETLDTRSELLPDTKEQFVTWPLANNLTYALLVGENLRYPSDAMTIWRKVIDNERPGESSWVYMPLDKSTPYYLPSGHTYWVMAYTNGNVLAITEEGTIYCSYDQGITWKSSNKMTMPSGFSGTMQSARTDTDGNIWIIDNNGRMWCGHQSY